MSRSAAACPRPIRQHLPFLACLRELDLANCDGIRGPGLTHLVGLTQLQTLNLRDTRVTDAGLEALKDLACLRELDLSNCKELRGPGLAI